MNLEQDVRHALRMLSHHKTWTIVAICTIALGIAPVTALFSVIDYAFAPIPAKAPDELVFWEGADFSRYVQLRDQNTTLVGLLAFSYLANPHVEVVSTNGIRSANVESVSGSYFSVLGVPAIQGRTMLPEDDLASAKPVAMISEMYWDRAFKRSPDAIGETIEIDRKRFTIVGVWPASFVGASGSLLRLGSEGPMRPEVMVPLAHRPASGQLFVVGRRKPGVSLLQVNGDVARMRFANAPIGTRPFKQYTYGLRGVLAQFQNFFASSVLTTLLLAVFFGTPLFLACVNIATFLASRAEDRRAEIAMRLSLGATRGRLIRQLLIESTVLTTLGASVGALFSYWWTRILANPPFNYYGDIPLQWRAFAFVAALILPVSIGCGFFPAKDATSDAAQVLQTFGTHFSRPKSKRTRTLMTIQVALSFFGVFCIGLLLYTVQTLDPAEANYNLVDIATFTVNSDRNHSRTQYEQIVAAVSQLPGVQSVSFSDQDVIRRSMPTAKVFTRDSGGQVRFQNAAWLGVDSRFFKTMGLPFALGSSFLAEDGPQRVVVGEALARALFPNESPLGKRFGRDAAQLDSFEIVGVVRDAKPHAAMPVAYAHDVCCGRDKTFEVRAAGPLSPLLPLIREAVRTISPDLMIRRVVVPAEELRAEYLMSVRPWKVTISYYAGFAAVLVVTGVFGLMSHAVARRTREIGIRMAVGGQRSQVLVGILLESVRIVVPGVIVGFASTLVASRLVWSFTLGLFSASDIAVTLIVAIAGMFLIATISGYLPARRASRVEPIVALRHN